MDDQGSLPVDQAGAFALNLERDCHTTHRQPCDSVHLFEEEISLQRRGRLTSFEVELGIKNCDSQIRPGGKGNSLWSSPHIKFIFHRRRSGIQFNPDGLRRKAEPEGLLNFKCARLKGPDQTIVIQLEGAHSLTDLNDRYFSALQLQRQISSVYLNDFVSLDKLEVPSEGLSPNHELRASDRRNLHVGSCSDLDTARIATYPEGLVYLPPSGINFQSVATFERDSGDGGFERALH